MLPFSASSCAASAGTSRVTTPSAAGVMRAVHTLPVVVSVNADAVPLPTAMSSNVNPVTVSLKVNVAVNAPLCRVVGPVISTVGAPAL